MFIILRKIFKFFFSSYLLVKCPVIHRLMGCGLVESTNTSGSDHSSSFSSKDRLSLNDTPSLVPTLQPKFNVAPRSQIIPKLAAFVSDRTSIAIGPLAPYHHATPFLRALLELLITLMSSYPAPQSPETSDWKPRSSSCFCDAEQEPEAGAWGVLSACSEHTDGT
jgi:hypothetical protein